MAAVRAGLVLFFVGNEAPVVTAPDPAGATCSRR